MNNRSLLLLPLFFSAGCFLKAPALYHVARGNETARMAELLEKGADPNERWGFMHGSTPLHAAAESGALDTARLLIERGADVNARGTWGGVQKNTPLHYAACVGHASMVRLLLEKGADPDPGPGGCWSVSNVKVKEGAPLELAEKNGHSMAAGLIRAAIEGKLGITAGGAAVAGQYAPLVSALLKDYAGEGRTIAVTRFSYADGRPSTDGNIVAERFTTELIRLKKLKVVERDQIERVLSELKLQNAGAIDPESARRIGRMLGADLLVIGGMVELPGAVLELNVRLAEVESGQAVGAASGRVPRDWVN
ncbi:MAG: ankyrin repeat domain-containing protein [Elusimicrobiota bacterium]